MAIPANLPFIILQKDKTALISYNVNASNTPLSALEKLRDAAAVRFEGDGDQNILSLATRFKERASKISGIRKIFENIGSILFSYFGFKTTTQKVKELYDAVYLKFKDLNSPAPENLAAKSVEHKPSEPCKSLPANIQKNKEDFHAYLGQAFNYTDIKHVIDNTFDRIEDLEEAENYIGSLKTQEEQEVAYAVLASIDHFEYACKYAKLIIKNSHGPYIVTTIDEDGNKRIEEVPGFAALDEFKAKNGTISLKYRANFPLLFHVLDKFGLRSDEEITEYLERPHWKNLKTYANHGFYQQAVDWLNKADFPYKNASLILKFTINLVNQHIDRGEFDKARALLDTIRFRDIKERLGLELQKKQAP